MRLPPALICSTEGHVPPTDVGAEDLVVNCLRCGLRLYWTGQDGSRGYVAKPDAEVEQPVKDGTVGYFNWRRDNRGGASCEKIAKEHVDCWQAMNKGFYNSIYLPGILHTEKLDADQWKLSLAELAKKFPCPQLVSKEGQSNATK